MLGGLGILLMLIGAFLGGRAYEARHLAASWEQVEREWADLAQERERIRAHVG